MHTCGLIPRAVLPVSASVRCLPRCKAQADPHICSRQVLQRLEARGRDEPPMQFSFITLLLHPPAEAPVFVEP